MAHKADLDPTKFRLPPTVGTPADITQLARELESLETYLHQAGIRSKGVELTLPKTSRAFDDIAELNKLDLLKPEHRRMLAGFITVIHTKAPVLHISFGAEPSSAFTARIVVWLRQQVSPYALVRIGRQPTIGGGCVVRTTNRQFDFSLRQYLVGRRGELARTMAAVDAKTGAAS